MKAISTFILFLSISSTSFCQSKMDSRVELSHDSMQVSSIDFSKRKKVFWTAGISGYTAMATGLYFAWYDKQDQSGFHFFNDWNEWQNVDKAGHVYSAYVQSGLIYDLSKWAGYSVACKL